MSLLDVMLGISKAAATGARDQHVDADDHVEKAALPTAFGDSTDLGDLVGRLFANSSDTQKQGLINQVMSVLGPQGSAIAADTLGVSPAEGTSGYSEQDAANISPEQVRALIEQARPFAPELADRLGGFYSEHQDLLHRVGKFVMNFIQKSRES